MLVNIHFQMDQKWPLQIRDNSLGWFSNRTGTSVNDKKARGKD